MSKNIYNRKCPALATTYEGRDPAFLDRVLPLVEFVEITPDSLAQMSSRKPAYPVSTLEELAEIARRARIILHGVGLSIGTYSGYSETYIGMLDELMERFDVEWHSEHLGYVEVDGQHLGTMLAVPKTEEMLDLICRRVQRIQERYRKPFLLENIVHLLPDYPGQYSEAAFLNELSARTGCGLILDVYNLECDAHNHRFDITAFLGELKLENVREVHLAGGVVHRGIRLDVHSRTTENSTVSLAQEVLRRAPWIEAVTYELLPQAIPKLGYDAIAAELVRLQSAIVN
jgi:uncharacterized protein